ncbi:MAG: 16S rRNA (cytosine(1402)-N(4))-methyltransferase, partial [Planctomycetales bacterium]|nr:16S rRNA (cytosine(1402)-N(4))-methyltransferase [Planctomycetales bacterium]
GAGKKSSGKKRVKKSAASPSGGFRAKSIDPATRTFQALRIVVNDELAILERALARLPDCLAPGGALIIISFHSLEDRLVKYAFRGDERLQIVTKRPVQAGDAEVASNPRSRSAKLRVARRAS